MFEESPKFLWNYDTANLTIFRDKHMLEAYCFINTCSSFIYFFYKCVSVLVNHLSHTISFSIVCKYLCWGNAANVKVILLKRCWCSFDPLSVYYVTRAWNQIYVVYCNDPKFSDRQVWTNSADPDQTAPRASVWEGLHCLPFPTESFEPISL